MGTIKEMEAQISRHGNREKMVKREEQRDGEQRMRNKQARAKKEKISREKRDGSFGLDFYTIEYSYGLYTVTCQI